MNIALNIDRKMVNLFFEIKRNMPLDTRGDMRIASPDIGHQLLKLHQQSEDTNLRRLIEKFMQHAGSEWINKLELHTPSKTMFYREHALEPRQYNNKL